MTLTYPNIAQDIEEATLDVKRKGREYKRARKKYLRVAGTQNGFASVDEFKRAKWGLSGKMNGVRRTVLSSCSS